MKHTQLIALASALLEPTTVFKPGQLVVWKDGLKNRRIPEYNQSAVVIGIKEGLIEQDKNSGSPYFLEPLELVLGCAMPDGEFHCFHYDPRRFRVIDKEEVATLEQKVIDEKKKVIPSLIDSDMTNDCRRGVNFKVGDFITCDNEEGGPIPHLVISTDDGEVRVRAIENGVIKVFGVRPVTMRHMTAEEIAEWGGYPVGYSRVFQ